MDVTVEEIEAFLDGRPVSPSAIAQIEIALEDPSSLVRQIAGRTSRAVRLFAQDDGPLPTAIAPPLPHRFEDLSALNKQCADLFRARDWRAALELRLVTCRLAVRYLGRDHRDTGTYVNSLGRILLELREFQRAAIVFQAATEMRSHAFGDRHSDTAISWTGLGRALEGLGDYDDARACHQFALEVMEETLGPNHPDTGVNLSEYGTISLTVGDLVTARNCLQRALEIARDIDGEQDPIYAGALIHMGCVEEASGDIPQAERLFREAEAILEYAYGPDHEDVAWALNHLGGLLLSTGKTSEAITTLTQASAIADQVVDPSSLLVSIYSNLAIAQANSSELPAAVMNYQKAVQICRGLFGDEHSLTLLMIRNLSLLEGNLSAMTTVQFVNVRPRFMSDQGKSFMVLEIVAA